MINLDQTILFKQLHFLMFFYPKKGQGLHLLFSLAQTRRLFEARGHSGPKWLKNPVPKNARKFQCLKAWIIKFYDFQVAKNNF